MGTQVSGLFKVFSASIHSISPYTPLRQSQVRELRHVTITINLRSQGPLSKGSSHALKQCCGKDSGHSISSGQPWGEGTDRRTLTT